MPIYNDPFSQVYNGLWTLVDRNNDIDLLVPKGNRIRFDPDNQVKRLHSNADLPELILTRTGGQYNVDSNNTYTHLIAEFTWQISTGDLLINPLFNPLTFELYRSMIDWRCVLCPLKWCGCEFVKDLILPSSEEGPGISVADEKRTGWSALLIVQVKMGFSLSNLKLKTRI